MTLRRKLVPFLLVASLVAGGLVASASPAPAAFHLMKVVEVFAGTSTDANVDFVELQMYQAGQNFVGGHTLHLYTPPTYPGDPFTRQDCPIPTNVANGVNQAPILFATTQAQTVFGTSADFTIPPMLSGAGGAVCFENIDCVSWGSFTGDTLSPVGTAEAPIPVDDSIHRDLKGNGTLEETDDTNQSAADFVPGPETPTPNGVANLGTMTCQPAGPGGGPPGSAYDLVGLKAKVRGTRATIRGRIEPSATGEQIKLTFFANGSPLRKLASKRATLNADSEFKKRFKVPSDSTRCKVVVRFQGAKLGQKKFKC